MKTVDKLRVGAHSALGTPATPTEPENSGAASRLGPKSRYGFPMGTVGSGSAKWGSSSKTRGRSPASVNRRVSPTGHSAGLGYTGAVVRGQSPIRNGNPDGRIRNYNGSPVRYGSPANIHGRSTADFLSKLGYQSSVSGTRSGAQSPAHRNQYQISATNQDDEYHDDDGKNSNSPYRRAGSPLRSHSRLGGTLKGLGSSYEAGAPRGRSRNIGRDATAFRCTNSQGLAYRNSMNMWDRDNSGRGVDFGDVIDGDLMTGRDNGEWIKDHQVGKFLPYAIGGLPKFERVQTRVTSIGRGQRRARARTLEEIRHVSDGLNVHELKSVLAHTRMRAMEAAVKLKVKFNQILRPATTPTEVRPAQLWGSRYSHLPNVQIR